MSRGKVSDIVHSNVGAMIVNIALAYLLFMLTRVVFALENYTTFIPQLTWASLWTVLKGALVFDTSAIMYLNIVYIVLTLFPLHIKETDAWHRAMRWLFVITNGLGLAMNLTDSVYFKYTGRRTTMTVFDQFGAENNLLGIFMTELWNHWYLLLIFAVMIFLLWLLFVTPRLKVYRTGLQYYGSQALSLLLALVLAVVGMRGSVTAGTKPIAINHANRYASRPVEASLVLNTPFSMIRTIGKKAFITPQYIDLALMEATYSPIHCPDTVPPLATGKNVVVLIVESMGKEYMGYFNHDIDGYNGYTPFLDSLATRSLTFTHSFACGRISMDAMPSILCGIPMMVETFFLTPASLNKIEGLPLHLDKMGYTTAFFHGGHNISMGFNAFGHAIGFERYYGLDEYCAAPGTAGMDDFDGKWAIYDEPFLNYTAGVLDTLPQPFMATVFTASNHHPYSLPEQYSHGELGDNGSLPIHRTARYTDNALRLFMKHAAKQPWYENTVFVITADHTNLTDHARYQTDLGLYEVPIMFFTPDGSLPAVTRDDVVAQHSDVTPTLLALLGYGECYVAFGNNLLDTSPEDSWAFNYNNGVYQLVTSDYLLQFDGEQVTGVYAWRTDPLLHTNLVGKVDTTTAEQKLKALIQQYMSRMNEDRLTDVEVG